MAIDPYAPCPCGTGKKIKFCCPDLVNELDKIQRMLEGDQRAAALEFIESIEGKFPDRPCLLSYKAMLQGQLGQVEQAQATVERFLAKHPDNPVALAEKAMLATSDGGAAQSVALLQDALEKCGEQLPSQVYGAIGLVGQMLIAENYLVAGRAHLVFQVALGAGRDERAVEVLVRVNGSPNVPLLAKQDYPLLSAPDDALWKADFAKAQAGAMRGCWRKAARDLEALGEKVGYWPPIAQNLAVLRTWLAETPAAIADWRRYAAQPIELDDAVEAEALAQSIDPASVDMVPVFSIEYGVNDIEVLGARLAAHPQAVTMPIDLARLGNEEEPPPRSAYWLLDRPVPASAANLSIGDIPRVAGQAFVYGKQTDRAARVELAVYEPELVAAQAALAEVAGDALGAEGVREVATEVPALQHLLNLNWRLPEETTPEQRAALVDEQRRDLVLNRWPELKQHVFGDRSAAEAAKDPKLQIPVLAALLLLELGSDQLSGEFDFNELRRKLGLPETQRINPRTVPVARIPLVRLGRIDVKQLTDEELVEQYRRADHYRHIAALARFAHEIIGRESLDKKVDKAEVYGLLAQIDADAARSLEYLEKARQLAEAAGKSSAPWDLAELALRISRGDLEEADRLLFHVREQHMREPGVAQALFQILTEAGIIGPDGKPAGMPQSAEPAGGGIVLPGAAASEAGKIWTPGSDQPSAGKKSALWTPGD